MMETQGMQEQQTRSQDWSWSFWPVVPIYPYGQRRTLRQEVIKDTIWTFDQLQGIFYVIVPIRMTVIKLIGGGLLIYAPVAPTPECIGLVNELVAAHGDVKYIIFPTISGVEHKVFVGPFAKRFPKAQVFVAPNQWSFPLNLPLSWLGFPGGRTEVLPYNSTQTPFADEFDYEILGPIELGPGPFAEVAFYHKHSHTLLVTDTMLSVPEEPLPIVQLDPYPLLFHAKDRAFDTITDSQANRRKGWQRTSLFTLYFEPSVLNVNGVNWGQVLRDALKAPDKSKKAYFGIFPFQWTPDWKQSFDALRGDGSPFVAPILQTLILNRAPRETIDWADKVSSWDFQRIIPCHFDSPIEASPRQFRQAFTFLEKKFLIDQSLVESSTQARFERDLGFLRKLDRNLYGKGITPPPKERI